MSGGRLGEMPVTQRVMRFVLWAEQLHAPPQVADVMRHFEVSRATANRMIGSWYDAKGLVRAGAWPKERRDDWSQQRRAANAGAREGAPA
jgi:hypothetical protein